MAVNLTEMAGYAAYAGTTGGDGKTVYTVSTDSDDASAPPLGSFREAIGLAAANGGGYIAFETAMVINLKAQVLVPSNVTIDSGQLDVTLSAPKDVTRLKIIDASNIIVSGLKFRSTAPNTEVMRDGIWILPDSTDKIWIDRCDFSDCGDGCIDVSTLVEMSTECRLTISRNRFSNHDKTMLIGSSNCLQSGRDETYCENILTADRKIFASVYGNYFDGTAQRHPKPFGPAYVHSWNNVLLINPVLGSGCSGMESSTGSQLLCEDNYIVAKDSGSYKGAWAWTDAQIQNGDGSYGDGPAYLRIVGGFFGSTITNTENSPSSVGDPPYTYTSTTIPADPSDFVQDIYDQSGTQTPEDEVTIQQLILQRSTTTISSDMITPTYSCHSVDTEGAAATDNLSTITAMSDGYVLVLRAASSSRTVVVKNGTGNIYLAGSDFSMDNARDTITLKYDSGVGGWLELCRSNNGS